MVKPAVMGYSRLLKSLGSEPLDKQEHDAVEMAGAACMYQYGSSLDARWLLGMAIAGTILPRAADIVEHQQKKARERRERQQATAWGQPANPPQPRPPEKEVSGSVVSITPNVG